MPDFRTLIAARNASFFGDFGRSGTGAKMDPQNEAYTAAIRAQNEGLPDWSWGGRDFPRISRKSRTDHWELMAPDYLALITAGNASFFGDSGSAGNGAKWIRKTRHA